MLGVPLVLKPSSCGQPAAARAAAAVASWVFLGDLRWSAGSQPTLSSVRQHDLNSI